MSDIDDEENEVEETVFEGEEYVQPEDIGNTSGAQTALRFVFLASLLAAGLVGIAILWKIGYVETFYGEGFWFGVSPLYIFVPLVLLAIVMVPAYGMIHIFNEWDRGVLLRLGKFQRVVGPGLVIVLPVFSEISRIISIREQILPLAATKTQTKDNIPTTVLATIIFRVKNIQVAVVKVEDYRHAIWEAAQAALRAAVSAHTLQDLLENRDSIGDTLEEHITKKAEKWGVEILDVLIKDILIPEELEAAMSQMAVTEQENLARIAKSMAEQQVSENLRSAADIYAENPAAERLRQQATLLEVVTRGGDHLILIPNEAAGSLVGTALALGGKSAAVNR